MENKESIEKREHERFQVEEGIFAVLRNDDRNLGEIIDISIAGLAFKYFIYEEKINGSSELDIFLIDSGFHSTGIPFKTVSDFEVNSNIPFSSVKLRRRGVQFTGLKHGQLSQIENFIKNHTSRHI